MCVNTARVAVPSNPSVLDVTAASSAAGGFLASPTLLKAFLESALESMDFTDRLSFNNAATRSVLASGLSRCLAIPMKDVAIEQSGMGDAGNVSPDYKFIDGGFTENTGIASTLGKVAADFPTDDYLGKFVHFDLDMTMGENRVQALFTLDSDNSNCNTQVTGAAGKGYCTNPKALGQHNANTGRPSSLIFDDVWPSNLDEDWTPYAHWTDANGVTTHSYYFKKRVTTVKNQFYKVPAGKCYPISRSGLCGRLSAALVLALLALVSLTMQLRVRARALFECVVVQARRSTCSSFRSTSRRRTPSSYVAGPTIGRRSGARSPWHRPQEPRTSSRSS